MQLHTRQRRIAEEGMGWDKSIKTTPSWLFYHALLSNVCYLKQNKTEHHLSWNIISSNHPTLSKLLLLLLKSSLDSIWGAFWKRKKWNKIFPWEIHHHRLLFCLLKFKREIISIGKQATISFVLHFSALRINAGSGGRGRVTSWSRTNKHTRHSRSLGWQLEEVPQFSHNLKVNLPMQHRVYWNKYKLNPCIMYSFK